MAHKRRNRRRRNAKTGGHTGPNETRSGPFFFKHPLSDIPRKTLVSGLIEVGKASEDRFQSRVESVVSILESVAPLQTIAALSVYGLCVRLTDSGGERRLYKDGRLNQAHVELVQALTLRIPQESVSETSPPPTAIQDLFDALPDLGEAFGLRRLVQIEAERSKQQQARLLLQEHLRLHTQSVRHWGFFDRVLDLTRKLYRPLDDAFVEHVGISATHIVQVFEYLVRRLEQRINERWQQLREAFRESSLEGLVHCYFKLNPHLDGSSTELVQFAKREGMSLEDMKGLILSDAILSLADAFTVTSDTVASHLGIPAAGVDGLFTKLSFSFGDLADRRPEDLMLDNPVWRRPMIRLGKRTFFCAIPQVFFSFIFPILRDLTAEHPTLKLLSEDRRADFLESQTADLFVKAFPGAEIVSGFEWREADTTYENDLLIRVDSHLLIIEAKSGAISWAALRGAPASAKRHIGELIYEPSAQSSRLAERIKAVVGDPNRRESLLPGLPLRLEDVRTVLRISVTLEDFAAIQSNPRIIKDTGWIPSGHTLAPCALLSDLEIVFDVLEPMAQKLHYLRRRAELEERMKYIGDELGLLGLYVATGFNLGDAEYGKQQFHIDAMSKDVDEYFAGRAEGIERAKPQLKLSRWWKDICGALEQRRFKQWTEAASMLLNVSAEEQNRAEELFKKVKKNVVRNWSRPNHRCSILIKPRAPRSDAMALYAFRDEASGDRRVRMENIASQLFSRPHVERCLVIGVNVDSETYPYSTLAVFPREDTEKGPRREEVRFY